LFGNHKKTTPGLFIKNFYEEYFDELFQCLLGGQPVVGIDEIMDFLKPFQQIFLFGKRYFKQKGRIIKHLSIKINGHRV
jgi:hypothetical protein